MNGIKYTFGHMQTVGAWALLTLALMTWVKSSEAATTHQIKVNLFGQPCTLQGPVEERMLQAIHSMSPEQIYPTQDEPVTSSPTGRALDKIHATTNLPTGLDRYRDRLTRRLEAQLELLKAVEGNRKDGKNEQLITVGKKNLNGAREKKFIEAVKKATDGRKKLTTETFETLFDVYNEGIEADPEEEFHRAIQRIKVQYTCSFEESGGDGQGHPDAEGK